MSSRWDNFKCLREENLLRVQFDGNVFHGDCGAEEIELVCYIQVILIWNLWSFSIPKQRNALQGMARPQIFAMNQINAVVLKRTLDYYRRVIVGTPRNGDFTTAWL